MYNEQRLHLGNSVGTVGICYFNTYAVLKSFKFKLNNLTVSMLLGHRWGYSTVCALICYNLCFMAIILNHPDSVKLSSILSGPFGLVAKLSHPDSVIVSSICQDITGCITTRLTERSKYAWLVMVVYGRSCLIASSQGVITHCLRLSNQMTKLLSLSSLLTIFHHLANKYLIPSGCCYSYYHTNKRLHIKSPFQKFWGYYEANCYTNVFAKQQQQLQYNMLYVGLHCI